MRILIISKYFPPYQSARALQIGKIVDAIGQCAQVKVVAGLPHNLVRCSDDNIRYVRYPKAKESKNKLFRICRRIAKEFESTNYFGSWVKKTSEVAEKVIGDFNPDIVMTSSTPFESHLVGLHLSKKKKIPWVTSFSDPWPATLMPVPYNVNSVPVLSSLQVFMMKKVIRECDAVHMPNKYAIEMVEDKLELDIRNKSYAIPHISNLVPKIINDDLDLSNKLVHIGHLSRERVSIELIKAVKLMVDQHKDKFDGMVCIGTVCPEFRKLVSEMRLESHISILGRMRASTAMEYAVKSRVLLLIEANMKKSPFLPSKFVDYIAAKRPILAITPKISSIRDYLDGNSICYSVDHDCNKIVNALLNMFNRIDNDCEEYWSNLSAEFKASNITRRYIEMFASTSSKLSHF